MSACSAPKVSWSHESGLIQGVTQVSVHRVENLLGRRISGSAIQNNTFINRWKIGICAQNKKKMLAKRIGIKKDKQMESCKSKQKFTNLSILLHFWYRNPTVYFRTVWFMNSNNIWRSRVRTLPSLVCVMTAPLFCVAGYSTVGFDGAGNYGHTPTHHSSQFSGHSFKHEDALAQQNTMGTLTHTSVSLSRCLACKTSGGVCLYSCLSWSRWAFERSNRLHITSQ